MNIMSNQWVWVVVQGSQGNEQMLGQHDTQADVSFIPCFLEKEQAMNGLGNLTKNPRQIYHVQAIIFEDLQSYAQTNGFMIYLLAATGEIIEKISS